MRFLRSSFTTLSLFAANAVSAQVNPDVRTVEPANPVTAAPGRDGAAVVTAPGPVAQPTSPTLVGTTAQPDRAGETRLTLESAYNGAALPPARVTVPVGEKVVISTTVLLALVSAPANGGNPIATPVDPNSVVIAVPTTPVTVAPPTNPQTPVVVNPPVQIGPAYPPPEAVPVPTWPPIAVPAFEMYWTKNGQRLPALGSGALVFGRVTPTDAGVYVFHVSGSSVVPPYSHTSQALILGVGQTTRLLNVSVRGALAKGAGESFTAGFVVGGGSQAKKMIVRAIGPTLAQFGVANPQARPVLRLFGSDGKPYTNGYLYPAVVGGLTYEQDLADSLATTGAFPTPAGSADAVVMMPFTAGAYTAQVTSGDGSAGEVLLEIYEVP